MSVKITLGQPPLTFKHKVEFDLPGGDTAYLTVTYLYKTRSQLAELMTKLNNKDDSVNGDNMEGVLIQSIIDMADNVQSIVSGWDVDADYTRSNLEQFCDEYPMGAQKIIEDYSSALMVFNQGN